MNKVPLQVYLDQRVHERLRQVAKKKRYPSLTLLENIFIVDSRKIWVGRIQHWILSG